MPFSMLQEPPPLFQILQLKHSGSFSCILHAIGRFLFEKIFLYFSLLICLSGLFGSCHEYSLERFLKRDEADLHTLDCRIYDRSLYPRGFFHKQAHKLLDERDSLFLSKCNGHNRCQKGQNSISSKNLYKFFYNVDLLFDRKYEPSSKIWRCQRDSCFPCLYDRVFRHFGPELSMEALF